MKQLPLANKMAKVMEMIKLQHQMTMPPTQQQHSEDKVEELQAEAKKATGII